MLLLPSSQECCGLIINEVASFGTPIVSTVVSGATVEFLSDNYSNLLAIPGKADDMVDRIDIYGELTEVPQKIINSFIYSC